MSHTNSTTNYSLPQFVTTDKPAWLTDINGAFSAIDTGMNNAQTKANTADTNAAQALLDASSASSAASAADAKGAGAVASIADAFQTTDTYAVGDYVIYNNLLYVCSVAVETPGAWTGSTNWSRATVEGMVDGLTAEKIPYDGAPGAPTTKSVVNGKADVAYSTILSSSSGITLLKFGKMYVADFQSAQIKDIVSALTGIIPQKTASAMIWDFTAQAPCNMRLSLGVITFVNAATWTAIANSSSDQVHGQIVFFED